MSASASDVVALPITPDFHSWPVHHGLVGARVADGIQVSDFTADMLPEAQENIEAGLAKREDEVDDFRFGNFWAWHIKADAAAAMYEARRELIWRGSIAAKYAHELAPLTESTMGKPSASRLA